MITINDLLNTPSLASLKPVAGRQGLNREIRAVSVMDAPDSYKWLRGGEFLLTSGYLYGDDHQILEYTIHNLNKAGCAGFGIKKNRFLSEIPKTLIEAADNMQFPVIEIPYDLTWSDIISEYYNLYFQQEDNVPVSQQLDYDKIPVVADNDRIYHELLCSLVKEESSERLFMDVTKHRSTKTKVYSYIVIISSSDIDAAYHALLEYAKYSRLRTICKTRSYIMRIDGEDKAVAIIEHYSTDDTVMPHEWQYMLFENIEDSDFDGQISAGCVYAEPRQMLQSYREAKDALLVGQSIYGGKKCYLYCSISFLCILFRNAIELVDLTLIESFVQNECSLGFDAMITLETYIRYGDREKTCNALYIHKNTLRNRLTKISDFFHFDVTDTTNILILAVLLSIWKLKNNSLNN